MEDIQKGLICGLNIAKTEIVLLANRIQEEQLDSFSKPQKEFARAVVSSFAKCVCDMFNKMIADVISDNGKE